MLNGYFPSIFTKKHNNNNSILVSEQSKELGIQNELIHCWKRKEYRCWMVLPTILYSQWIWWFCLFKKKQPVSNFYMFFVSSY